MTRKPQRKIEPDKDEIYTPLEVAQWTTPEEVTASAILTDNSETIVTLRHVKEFEKALDTGEASEVLILNVRALLAKWRLGAS